jgi:FtsP/CotA-like multicopper oxidase with cupredoxin domain
MLPFYLGEGEFPDTKPSAVPPGLQSGCKASNGSTEVIKVDAAEKWATLHFISAMSLKIGVVSVDEHPLWIYAIDGQYIKPQLADTFILHNGERVSAMIKLDKTPGDYTIRIANNLPNQVISGFAKLSYAGGSKTTASKPYINYGSESISASVRALDDNKLIPFNAPPAAPYANQTIFLSLHRVGFNWAWTLNNKTSFDQNRETIEKPLLFTPNITDPIDTELIIHTQNNTWVDIVFEILLGPENRAQPVHAMHKHSNRMYLLGRGVGPFVWPNVAEARKHTTEFNKLEDAQYRDTVVTASTIFFPSWTVVRYKVENPGAWILHCHMMTHLQGGMAVVLMDGVDVWPEVPGKYKLGGV